jgi:hypothetical protein
MGDGTGRTPEESCESAANLRTAAPGSAGKEWQMRRCAPGDEMLEGAGLPASPARLCVLCHFAA